MSKEWTKEKPTKEGWYFFRLKWWNLHTIECVLIWDCEGDGLYISRLGMMDKDSSLRAAYLNNAIWMKIDMPEV